MQIDRDENYRRDMRTYAEADKRDAYADTRDWWPDLESVPSFADWLVACGTSGFSPHYQQSEAALVRYLQAALILHEGPGRWPWAKNTLAAIYEFTGMQTQPPYEGPVGVVWGAYDNWLTSTLLVSLSGAPRIQSPALLKQALETVAEFPAQKRLLMELYYLRHQR